MKSLAPEGSKITVSAQGKAEGWKTKIFQVFIDS